MFCAKSWRQLYEHKQQNFILRWIASRAFALNGKHQLAPNKCWHASIFSTLQFARKIISPFAMYQWPWLLAKQYARSQDQHHKHYFLYIVQFSCWCSQASIWSIKVDCRSFSAVFSQQNLRCSICAGALRCQRNVLLRQDEFVRALQLLDKSCEIHVRTTTKSNNGKKIGNNIERRQWKVQKHTDTHKACTLNSIALMLIYSIVSSSILCRLNTLFSRTLTNHVHKRHRMISSHKRKLTTNRTSCTHRDTHTYKNLCLALLASSFDSVAAYTVHCNREAFHTQFPSHWTNQG